MSFCAGNEFLGQEIIDVETILSYFYVVMIVIYGWNKRCEMNILRHPKIIQSDQQRNETNTKKNSLFPKCVDDLWVNKMRRFNIWHKFNDFIGNASQIPYIHTRKTITKLCLCFQLIPHIVCSVIIIADVGEMEFANANKTKHQCDAQVKMQFYAHQLYVEIERHKHNNICQSQVISIRYTGFWWWFFHPFYFLRQLFVREIHTRVLCFFCFTSHCTFICCALLIFPLIGMVCGTQTLSSNRIQWKIFLFFHMSKKVPTIKKEATFVV